MADSDNWCMNVDGRVYGPYSHAQMREFVAERRLAYHSLVAPAGSRDFRPALQFPELKPLFSASAGAHESSGASAATGGPLLVIFEHEGVYRQGAGVLSDCPALIQLSATAALVRGPISAEALRDRLSTVVPNTERVHVFPCAEAAAACHGVSLDEHERIAKLMSGATGTHR